MNRPPRALLLAAGLITTLGADAPAVRAQQICGEWSQVAAPAGALAVTDVTAVSSTSALALASNLGLIHWDGNAWSQLALPDLSGVGTSISLRSTASVASGEFLIGGIAQTSVWTTEQLLLRWDGADWDVIESVELEPNIMGAPRYGSPEAVAAASPDDAWIIGIASGSGTGTGPGIVLTVHWDGSQLTEYLTPGVGNRQNNLLAAVAIASDDVWAVGEYNNVSTQDYTFHGMTYHWDGGSWSVIPNPSQAIASTHLQAVAAVASDDVWAAGDSPAGPLFLHWDGSAWSIVPGPPGVTTGTIQQIVAIASDDVWAVDSAWQVPTIGKFYHWDGTAWGVVTPGIAGATSVSRHGGMAAAGPCDVWAVGSIDLGSGIQPLIERLQSGGGPPTAAVTADGASGLLEVAPNPVRGSARIRFAVPGAVPTSALIYDVRGTRVRTLPAGRGLQDGLDWNRRDDAGRAVPGGVYFLRVEASDGQALTRKVTVLR